ncbi:MAG: type I restriction enzyme HsdR N-terminal domain-containing protein [Dehalococcoidales bacterium]|nr:type I restriction enzyme HsdR N-terminal domain-containing protein [Dehalococcoidales bacterium]
MMPKRVSDRLVRMVTKFQQVLKIAKDRDVNESDTVSIVKDMLAEVFGYDKYLDVTSEFAIRGTFCDLAIKIENKVEYMIEAKAIGIDLKENHIRQAIEYGANNGVPWIILTNGIVWQIYKIRFEKPINYDLVCAFNFEELDIKNEEYLEKLYIVCKEGLIKAAREEFHEKILTVNKFVLGALMLRDEVIGVIRRELRKLSDGVLVGTEEITEVLMNEVLKRDVIEGDEATKAQSRVRRFYGKVARRPKDTGNETESEASQEQPKEDISFSDKLLNQGEQQAEPKQE